MVIIRNCLDTKILHYAATFGSEIYIELTQILRQEISKSCISLLKIGDICKPDAEYGNIKYYMNIGQVYGHNCLSNLDYTNIHVLDKDCPIFTKGEHQDLVEYIHENLVNQYTSMIAYDDILDVFSNIYFIFNKTNQGSFL